ncbi:MAG: class I SAM-dependent methyltransferase [bacterium]|nr:class I SAM-dependent methyltransferase [bacterium]
MRLSSSFHRDWVNFSGSPFRCLKKIDTDSVIKLALKFCHLSGSLSEQMLKYHLNPVIDLSSRNAGFIDRSVKWIVSHFNVGQGTQIADFGCGPGLYASRLAQKHAGFTGIDISKGSIRYARKRAEKYGRKIQYVNQNYLEFETEDRYDLIILIMCDFCALGPQQRKVFKSHSRLTDTYKNAIIQFIQMANTFPKPVVVGMKGNIDNKMNT